MRRGERRAAPPSGASDADVSRGTNPFGFARRRADIPRKPHARGVSVWAFNLAVGAAFTYAVCACILASTFVRYAPAELAVTCFIGVALFMLVFTDYKTLTAALLLAAVFFAYVWFARAEHAERFLAAAELWQMVRGTLVYRNEYDAVSLRLLAGALSCVAALFMHGRFSLLPLALMGAVPFALTQLMGYVLDIPAFLLFLVCVLLLLTRFLAADRARGALTAFLALPFCLLTVLAADRLPMPGGESFGRSFADTFAPQVNAVGDFIHTLFNPKYFSFQSTGYADTAGRLGGPVRLSGRQVMSVDAPGRVYLSGAAHDLYTGESWGDQAGARSQDRTARETNRLEAMETAVTVNLWQVSRAGRPGPVQLTELTVYPGEFRTGTLFRPAKFTEFEVSGYDGPVFVSAQGDLSADDLLPRGASYRFNYLETDYENRRVRRVLQSAEAGFYTETRAGYGRLSRSTEWLSGLLGELAGYAADNRARYTQLPDALPQRVRDLARDITAGCESDYERLQAITAYLSAIPYTLSPPPVPEGADFVDFFLFEEPSGYCVYYASAFAVLARCVGLPARYLEGYLCPPAKTDGLYVITNRQAHAWAEAYLEGYGWLAVEATPPFAAVAGDEADSAAPPALGTDAAPVFTPEFMEDPYYEEYMRGIGLDAYVPPVPEPAPEGPVFLENAGVRTLAVTGGTLAALAAALGLFILVRRAGERLVFRRVSRLDARARVQVYFQGILKITAFYHYPHRAGETPAAYAARLRRRFAFQSDALFLNDLAAVYYRAKYGARPPSDADAELMRRCHGEMALLMRQTRNALRFWILRYGRRVTALPEERAARGGTARKDYIVG